MAKQGDHKQEKRICIPITTRHTCSQSEGPPFSSGAGASYKQTPPEQYPDDPPYRTPICGNIGPNGWIETAAQKRRLGATCARSRDLELLSYRYPCVRARTQPDASADAVRAFLAELAPLADVQHKSGGTSSSSRLLHSRPPPRPLLLALLHAPSPLPLISPTSSRTRACCQDGWYVHATGTLGCVAPAVKRKDGRGDLTTLRWSPQFAVPSCLVSRFVRPPAAPPTPPPPSFLA